MNRRVLVLCVAVAVAGCGYSTRSISYRAPSDTELGECQRQAFDDPKVKKLVLENFTMQGDPVHDQQLRMARRDATNACLRARGMTLPGGVEPVNRSPYLL